MTMDENTGQEGLPRDTGRAVRFGVAGVISTAIYVLLASGGYMLYPQHSTAVSVIAYLICIAVSFTLQRNFAFRADGRFHFEFPRFVASSLLGLLLSTVIVQLGVKQQLSPLTCYVLVAVVVAPISYLLLGLFVFKTRQSDKK